MIVKKLLLLSMLIVSTLSANAKEVSAYYEVGYQPVESIKKSLSSSGFEVLTAYSPAKKSYLHVLVFTNKRLIALASKQGRGFSAVQRLLVNDQKKTVSVTNPNYWLNAFMQDDYKQEDATAIKQTIQKALGELKPSKDVLKEKELASYHYAISMPYYEDMLVLKEGKKLDEKIKTKKKLFDLELQNGSHLLGLKMSKSTEKFIEVIGEENALLLPYTILIEEDKAYILQAKYYLAISYPLLSLGQFMQISSVPDAIERKLKKSFNK